MVWYNGKKKRPGCIRSPGIYLTTFYENGLRLNRIALSKKSDSAEHPSQTAYVLEQILERHQLVAVFILGVNIVVDSDVAHIIGREYLLDIKTGVQLVSSKAGKILCDDDGDVAVAHVIHHLFKGWAIEIRAGIAIVHIKSGVLEPILIGVLLQDKFLRRDLSRVFSSRKYNFKIII